MGYFLNNTDRPVIGVTIGDFNGVGPEIILKTLSDSRILKICIPVVYGSLKIFNKQKRILETEDINFNIIKGFDTLNSKRVNLINCWEEDFELNQGKSTSQAGKCALLALTRATDDLLAQTIDGVVTAPLNKKNIQSEEFKFPGHTEFFTEKSQVNDSLMFLVSEGLRVGVVTGHIPLGDVKAKLTKEKIVSKINILYKTLKNDFGLTRPKIAILGLNPHAGEEGLLGNEEITIIKPILEDLKNKGILIHGPFPADGFFGSGHYEKFDGILAMYHDQGLVPFKTIAFERGVNYTAGLPIVRTSPDHGTGYDIAGKGIASETSFREALFLAVDIVKNRKPILV
ncbi:MAG TPA: 4-hydroxythreonine-4-phosphate dehydrogenase PdxA [Cytophagaceae bacterium]|jgi:4-hydroxythreonine-4-phosphate dehydrogenase